VVLALAGCLEHTRNTVPEKEKVHVVVVNENSADSTLIASPPALVRELTTELAGQGLAATLVDDAVFIEAFRTRRSTQGRLRFLADKLGAGGDGLVLLVETRSAFYSLLEGRFRWVVNTKASFTRLAHVDAPVSATFEAPAILNFPHQGTADALRYVSGPIAREVRSLAARYLDEQSTDSGTPAPTAPAPAAPVVAPVPPIPVDTGAETTETTETATESDDDSEP